MGAAREGIASGRGRAGVNRDDRIMTMHAKDIPDPALRSVPAWRAAAVAVGGIERVEPAAIRRPRRGRRHFYRDRAKRLIDVALVLASAPVTVPLVLLMAALVALDGASPFYSQRRLGRAGRVFSIWKMRTMVPQADAQLAAHLDASPDAAREWHATQKLRDDPRITRIGRILRKTSLDEVPQFWNVLTGEMSLIGPRPMMVEQAELYPGRAYYALRPGITGPWQVSDRNDTTFAARAQYDQAYYEGLSMGLDARIFWRTFAVILMCTGR
jgi:lipopolysaccharide/colanic/teichoic acid biosynthesis glycosyltransferase